MCPLVKNFSIKMIFSDFIAIFAMSMIPKYYDDETYYNKKHFTDMYYLVVRM